MNATTKARITKAFDDHAASLGHTVRLPLSGEAYCSKMFDRIYDEHAARIGRRPAFTVGKAADEGMVVATTPQDVDHARAIVTALEAAV